MEERSSCLSAFGRLLLIVTLKILIKFNRIAHFRSPMMITGHHRLPFASQNNNNINDDTNDYFNDCNRRKSKSELIKN